MAQLSSITQYLDSLLETKRYPDQSLNGLQVEAGAQNVMRIAFAVDAGLAIVKRAVEAEAQLLVVHHGILWGALERMTGPLARKLELLYKRGCSLYASHLPLDGNGEVGNAAELSRWLGLGAIQPFFEIQGVAVGASGSFTEAQSVRDIAARFLTLQPKRPPLVLQFGEPRVRRVAVVTGSGSSALRPSYLAGYDLLISGEPKHEVYHLAQELQMNAIFAGHYLTETFGVRALERRLQSDFDVQTIFLDDDSGI